MPRFFDAANHSLATMPDVLPEKQFSDEEGAKQEEDGTPRLPKRQKL
jgi:hypothetical protein